MVKELSLRVIDGIKSAAEFLPIYGTLQREKLSDAQRVQTKCSVKTIIQTVGTAILMSTPEVIMCLYAIQDTLNYN